MKKEIILMLVLIVALFIIGCQESIPKVGSEEIVLEETQDLDTGLDDLSDLDSLEAEFDEDFLAELEGLELE